MFGLGMAELFIILVIVVIMFGSRKLPLLGQALGSSIHGFRKAVHGEDDPPKNALSEKEESSKQQ